MYVCLKKQQFISFIVIATLVCLSACLNIPDPTYSSQLTTQQNILNTTSTPLTLTQTDNEAFDLNLAPNANHQLETQTLTTIVTLNNESSELKSDTEYVQNEDNTEDKIIEQKKKAENKLSEDEDSVKENEGHYPLFRGRVAIILAGTFLIISIIAYGCFILWRRYLEKIYGSREMLVDEDDFIVREDDFKSFSI